MPNTPAPCLNSIRDFCDEPTLVAYAPYDEEGNLKLYQTGSPFLSPAWSGGNLSFSGVSGGSGVIVGTGTTWGYLKYNLDSLGLGNSFSIEMSVRGGALKRSDTTLFFLANNDNLNLNWSKFQLLIHKWKILACNWYNWSATASNEATTCLSINNSNVPSANLNDFFKIKFEKTWNIYNLILLNKNWSQIDKQTTSSLLYFIENSLYIGSWYQKNMQWNDIIDYVKIYN